MLRSEKGSRQLLRMVRPLMICALALMLSFNACATRTIYVPHGQPVRLRQTLKNVKVWVYDKAGNAVEGEIDLPEGWYCLPDVK